MSIAAILSSQVLAQLSTVRNAGGLICRVRNESGSFPAAMAAMPIYNISIAYLKRLFFVVYNFYLFRTQIYADLRRKLFPQLIKCLTFNFLFSAQITFYHHCILKNLFQKTIIQLIINSIEDFNNLSSLLNLIFKILIICVYLRPVIKSCSFSLFL